MKSQKSKISKVSKMILCIMLSMTMIAPSLTSFAADSGGDAATGDQGTAETVPNGDAGSISNRGNNVIVNLMRVNNTTEPYKDAIAAHNASSTSTWSEMGVSIVDNYLNDYPTYMLQDDTLKNSAVIRVDRRGTEWMKVATTNGNITRWSIKNVYSAMGKSSPSSFKDINVVGNAIKSNPEYYAAFQNKTLSVDVVMSLAEANQSALNDWSNKFIALWSDEGSVDDILNNMYDDSGTKYYENLLKYLDLLLVVNKLCNNTQTQFISKFLTNLNQDGSDDFVTICAIACVRSDTPYGDALIPLPIYYSFVTREQIYAYTHFELDGNTGSPVIPNDPGISYESNPSGYLSDMQGKYDSVKTNASSRYELLWRNRSQIWWLTGSSGSGLAQTLRPTDLNGYSTGNCSYTFLAMRAIGGDALTKSTPASIVSTIEATTAAAGGGTSIDDTKNSPLGQFSISATSDKFKISEGESNIVDADFMVDLKLTAEQRQTIGQLYSAQIATTGSKEATLEIEYDFECTMGSGDSGSFLDQAVFPTGMSGASKKVTIPNLTWEKAVTLFDGNTVVQWKDTNITITENTTNRYYAKVTLVMADGTKVRFAPKGKVLSDRDEYEAYDEVSWVYIEDSDIKGAYYSTIRDGNYVEIKDDTSPHYYEEYEAMAGIPTTEDVYVGAGATEFMVNTTTEFVTDDDDKRYYNFKKTFNKCVEEDAPCEYDCDGELVDGDCPDCGTYNAKRYYCYEDGDTTVTLYCSECGRAVTDKKIHSCTWEAGVHEHAGTHSTACLADGGSGAPHSTGAGCIVREKINCAHPHVHDILGTMEQEIDTFSFLDITAADLWQVQDLDYEYNEDLLDSFTNKWQLETGYAAFYEAGKYESGNGRLFFSFVLPEDENQTAYFGDTKRTYPSESQYYLLEKAIIKSHKEFNVDIRGKTIQTTCSSDYITLTTTEGFQTVTYNDQVAPLVQLTSEYFDEGGGSDNDTINANNVVWNESRTWDDLWKHESHKGLSSMTAESGGQSYSSYKWDATHITRSGYTGSYSTPDDKYNNENETDTLDPTLQWDDYGGCGFLQPNRIVVKGSESFVKGAENMRMTQTGINIKDSTEKPSDDAKGVWSADDDKYPVSNGEWNTGNFYLTAPKVIDYNATLGPNWATKSNKDYYVELGYTKGKSKINNIVIHDPVSCQYAELLGGADKPDEFVDQRTSGSISAGGDPEDRDRGVCPGDYTCQYRVLECTDPEAGHECQLNDPACYTKINGEYVYTCMNPHHHKAGESWDATDPANHCTNGDLCWKACNDDSKHKATGVGVAGSDGGSFGAAPDYINLDRSFTITYPSTGDFAENPSLYGILETSQVRGKGYYDGMDTSKWTRNKYVTFTVDVIDENGTLWMAGTPIDVYDIRQGGGDDYTFYCPMENIEQSYGSVEFNPVAINAPESEYVYENQESTNAARSTFSYAARHSANKIDYMDVIGYIGSLTINDTGDLRFAELFKRAYSESDTNFGWLIPNVVKKVYENIPNKLVIDSDNVRQDYAGSTYWHDVYGSTSAKEKGTLYMSSGGKHYENVLLPLTPADNPIKSLQNQPMRAGYNLLMDIQTVGNYYGENRKITTNSAGEVLSSQFVDGDDMYFKMQIVPSYWLLDLDTGTYEKLDVYMSVNGEYQMVNMADWNGRTNVSNNFNLYLNWLDESARRNYTRNEQTATSLGVEFLTGYNADGTRSSLGSSRSPQVIPDIIGNAQRLFLNDLDRTFVGGSYTYGEYHNASNADDAIAEVRYIIQGQRWHFTLGLPSSSVFVEHGKDCTTANIEAVSKKNNAVVVCTANFKVRGEVWTLGYDGSSINFNDTDSSGNKGFQIVPNGKAYKAPNDDPVIVVYSNKYTSQDDLRTEGTH